MMSNAATIHVRIYLLAILFFTTLSHAEDQVYVLKPALLQHNNRQQSWLGMALSLCALREQRNNNNNNNNNTCHSNSSTQQEKEMKNRDLKFISYNFEFQNLNLVLPIGGQYIEGGCRLGTQMKF